MSRSMASTRRARPSGLTSCADPVAGAGLYDSTVAWSRSIDGLLSCRCPSRGTHDYESNRRAGAPSGGARSPWRGRKPLPFSDLGIGRIHGGGGATPAAPPEDCKGYLPERESGPVEQGG